MDECDIVLASKCSVGSGLSFSVNVYLNDLGNLTGYDGFAMMLGYSGLSPDPGKPEIVWPECVLDGYAAGSGFISRGCARGIGAPLSTYAGKIVSASFMCAGDGSATLMHGDGETAVYDEDLVAHFEHEPDETATINCIEPLTSPGDTDGDDCPDAQELELMPQTGGQRDFLNEWDYFNPTGDGENRIDDVVMVSQAYYVDAGDPNYNPGTDRTALGPNAWNLGPPNGEQRVDDVLAIIYQYFHDCS
jgi:hypothetical protein